MCVTQGFGRLDQVATVCTLQLILCSGDRALGTGVSPCGAGNALREKSKTRGLSRSPAPRWSRWRIKGFVCFRNGAGDGNRTRVRSLGSLVYQVKNAQIG